MNPKFRTEPPVRHLHRSEGQKVQRSLKFSILDGSFYNLMDGFTSSFITPYALFLKAPTIIISLLSALPDLFGSIFQLLAIKANEFFKSRKILIVFAYFIQAVLWLPLLLIPKFAKEGAPGGFLLLFITLISLMGYFGQPLWRGMMGELVPEHERGNFFSKRNKTIALVCFVSTFVAGWILQHFSVTNPMTGFTILFVVAFLARSLSAFFIFMMYERRAAKKPFIAWGQRKEVLTLKKFLHNLTKSDFGIFVLCVCLFRISVAIASPFFAVYELKFLGFSYLQYTIMTAVEIIASFLMLGLWGRVNDNKGSKRVIIITGLLIPLIPLLFLVSTDYLFLLAATALSGVAWGGFNLAVGNFLFDASDSENRVKYVSYFNLLHGIAIFFGAIFGGILLNVLPQTAGSIKTLFLISGIGRFAVAALLFPLIKEMRIVQVKLDFNFFNYSIFIKPRHGFVEDPFDYYMAYEKRLKNRPQLKMDHKFMEQQNGSYNDPEAKLAEEKNNYRFLQRMFDSMNDDKKKPPNC